MYGDRRTELVCIGADLDCEAARAQLEECCLTWEEMGRTGVLRVMHEQTQYRLGAISPGTSSFVRGTHAHAEVDDHVVDNHDSAGRPG